MKAQFIYAPLAMPSTQLLVQIVGACFANKQVVIARGIKNER